MKRFRLLLLILLLAVLGAGCAERSECELVATTAPLQQFAAALCDGTELEVGLVVSGPVSCVHDYTLSTRQMVLIERAKTVILSDPALEPFMADALKSAGDVLSCGDGLALLPGEEAGKSDPHVWLDPRLCEIMVQNLKDGLSERYPAHEATFEKNAAALCARLESLYEDGLATLSDLSGRGIVTFHDGFSYFADAFELELLAAIEEEAGSEASAKELEAIIALVREQKLPAIFTEKNGSLSAASVISSETGCAVGTLDMLLSGADYFEGMNENLRSVREAMQ